MDAVTRDEFGDLFNSRVEAGIRAVVVLELLRPETADLTEMVLFDHVVVHTGDLGGPTSLHVDVPGRQGELLVRRRLLETSLQMMRRCHLLEEIGEEQGLVWRASDEAASFLELLETPYSMRLKSCAAWLATQVQERTKAGFEEFVRGRIGHWGEAFSSYGERR